LLINIAAALPHLVKKYERRSNLRILNLKGCYSLNETQLEKLLPLGATSIELLNLEMCSVKNLNPLHAQPFLERLRYLNLSKCRSLGSSPQLTCPSLRTLCLAECNGALNLHLPANTNPFLKTLEDCRSTLTELDVSSTHILDIFLQTVGTVTSLRKLTLQDCPLITSPGLTFLTKLTNLTSLNLSWNTNMHDYGIIAVASACSNLKELKMAQLYSITDRICPHIQKLTNLQFLDLEEDFRVTKSGLGHIFPMPSLKTLNLRGLGLNEAAAGPFSVSPACTIYWRQ